MQENHEQTPQMFTGEILVITNTLSWQHQQGFWCSLDETAETTGKRIHSPLSLIPILKSWVEIFNKPMF